MRFRGLRELSDDGEHLDGLQRVAEWQAMVAATASAGVDTRHSAANSSSSLSEKHGWRVVGGMMG